MWGVELFEDYVLPSNPYGATPVRRHCCRAEPIGSWHDHGTRKYDSLRPLIPIDRDRGVTGSRWVIC